MSFLWPWMLISVLLVPALMALYWRDRRRARALAAGYAGLRTSLGRTDRREVMPHLPWILFAAGLAMLTVAMARPQAELQVPRLEGTVVLAFDVSGSMAATDFTPSRMEAAKAAARSFVEKQPSGVRLAIVAFSDSGFAVQAPTYDRDEIMAAIGRLKPERGTSLANGILVSLNTIEASREAETRFYSNITPVPTASPTPMPAGKFSSASIVLLSDGENNQRPDPRDAARLAADRGVRIYAIGIGTAAGVDLNVEGFTVHTRLDEPALQELAQATGGAYYAAPTKDELRRIYEGLAPELSIRPEQMEITALLAGAGVALLIAGAAASMWRYGRIA